VKNAVQALDLPDRIILGEAAEVDSECVNLALSDRIDAHAESHG
jgi:hypothetical protein